MFSDVHSSLLDVVVKTKTTLSIVPLHLPDKFEAWRDATDFLNVSEFYGQGSRACWEATSARNQGATTSGNVAEARISETGGTDLGAEEFYDALSTLQLEEPVARVLTSEV